MPRLIAFAVTALLMQGASAQYRCSQAGGTVSFQQTPCASASQQQKLELRDAVTTPPPGSPTGSAAPAIAASGTVEQRMAASMAKERRVREIKQQVADIEGAIAARNDMMARELERLRSRKSQAANNLAGAVWEQSLSAEMQAVTQKYKALNDVDLERLQAERARLVQAEAAVAAR